MKLETVDFHSSLFRKSVSFDVLMPSGGGPFPVVYFHHGLGNDRRTPLQRTRLIERIASLELMFVLPDAERSWFANDSRPGGRAWEDHLAMELVDQVDRRFPTAPGRETRGQTGFSMGGYGAMMLAMRHPDRFSAVYAFSGSYHFGHAFRADRPERSAFMQAVAPPGGRYDLFRLSERLLESQTKLAIHFCVGSEDHLLQANRQLHLHFQQIGLSHTYEEYPGKHSWKFVDGRIVSMLDFMRRYLRKSESV
jgi:S-formylglutathione hydrolase FrmB